MICMAGQEVPDYSTIEHGPPLSQPITSEVIVTPPVKSHGETQSKRPIDRNSAQLSFASRRDRYNDGGLLPMAV